MKKRLMIAMLTVLMVGAVAVTGSVYAQAPDPQGSFPGAGYGYQAQLSEDGLGIYHDELMAAFSEALGIPVEELEARIEAGETLVEIALAEGMLFEDVKALMPVGNFGNPNGSMGRGGRWANSEFTPPGLNYQYNDGICLEDGTVTPQYLQRNFGDRGAGRWNR